jgi:hypothetical protein
MDNGEPCYVSSSSSGLFIKKSRLGLLGNTVFVADVDAYARLAMMLSNLGRDILTPPDMRTPHLQVIVNEILHSKSLDEVSLKFNAILMASQNIGNRQTARSIQPIPQEASSLPPQGFWHSPFSDCSLNAEDLVRELALNAVSKILMVGLLSDESAEVAMGPDALSVYAPALQFRPTIPFPPELKNYVQSEWLVWFNVFLDEYGIGGALDELLPRKIPDGEKLGALFRHFRVMQSLFQYASQRAWPVDRILGIHGAESPEIFGRLQSAGITYLLVWREEHIREAAEAGRQVTEEMLVDCFGSGCMKALSMDEAETLARDAFARQSESTRRIFRLSRAWCVDSWSSNHPRFR